MEKTKQNLGDDADSWVLKMISRATCATDALLWADCYNGLVRGITILRHCAEDFGLDRLDHSILNALMMSSSAVEASEWAMCYENMVEAFASQSRRALESLEIGRDIVTKVLTAKTSGDALAYAKCYRSLVNSMAIKAMPLSVAS